MKKTEKLERLALLVTSFEKRFSKKFWNIYMGDQGKELENPVMGFFGKFCKIRFKLNKLGYMTLKVKDPCISDGVLVIEFIDDLLIMTNEVEGALRRKVFALLQERQNDFLANLELVIGSPLERFTKIDWINVMAFAERQIRKHMTTQIALILYGLA